MNGLAALKSQSTPGATDIATDVPYERIVSHWEVDFWSARYISSAANVDLLQALRS
jgi:hypothetical protein